MGAKFHRKIKNSEGKFLKPNAKKIALTIFFGVIILFLPFLIILLPLSILQDFPLFSVIEWYVSSYIIAGILLLVEQNQLLLCFMGTSVFIWAYLIACLFCARHVSHKTLVTSAVLLGIVINPLFLFGSIQLLLEELPGKEFDPVKERMEWEEAVAKEVIASDITIPSHAITPPEYERGWIVNPETCVFKEWKDGNLTYKIYLYPSAYSLRVCTEGNVSLEELKRGTKKYVKHEKVIEMVEELSEKNKIIMRTLSYNIFNESRERKVFVNYIQSGYDPHTYSVPRRRCVEISNWAE